MDDRYWFAPKRFGYGAGLPVRWQGWALVGAMLAGVLLAAQLDGPLYWLTVAVILACALPIAAERTRGGWHWRWGE